MMRKLCLVFTASLVVACGPLDDTKTGSASSALDVRQQVAPRALPATVGQLKLGQKLTVKNNKGLSLRSAGGNGPFEVIAQLSDAPAAVGTFASVADRQSYIATLKAAQSTLISKVQKAGYAKVLGTTQMVLNAVVFEADQAALAAIASDAGVTKLNQVADYRLALSETVPYIGAAAVQGNGYDGSGVKVAVVDSGIDYHHANLGGSGNLADFWSNDGTFIEPGTFPTQKVVGGVDLVGGYWPGVDPCSSAQPHAQCTCGSDGIWSCPEIPDPDPLDDGVGRGHGTHVADIIGGAGGVAPGVDLYAVKVCSSVSNWCSGIALLMAMEYVADPDGDGDPSDHMDVVNMSLGSLYGQAYDDDLTQAVENASRLGVLTVAAAGNDGDRPFISSTPAAARSAISVAQTSVPSAFLPYMEVLSPAESAGNYPAIHQDWSAAPTAIQGEVYYPSVNSDGCGAFAEDLTGKIVVVDRGACNFTLKILNIQNAGGVLGIIALVAPGEAFPGGDGGDGPITIPAYMIDQAAGNILRANNAVVKFDPTTGASLNHAMVGSSARGPRFDDMLLKPEIGAPGASVSAVAGSGAGTAAFGGTSGATPMVAGSAALLLQQRGELSPVEAKALLMTTGDTNIVNKAPSAALAPVSRIGGGEVRVNLASDSPVAAWVDGQGTSALSFGFQEIAQNTSTLLKMVRLRNYSDKAVTYSISSAYRFAEDNNGAVTVTAPSSVKVQPNSDKTLVVTMKIDGTKLGGNFLNSGFNGADPEALTKVEYDGYLTLDDGANPIHLPWHVLPRKAADVKPDKFKLNPGPSPYPGVGYESVGLKNDGVGLAQNDAYSLLYYSPNRPEGGPGEMMPLPDLRAVGVQTFPVPAGYCSGQDSFIWAFAINSWERQTHLFPVIYWIWLDTNQDGWVDYYVFNADPGVFTGSYDGRQLTWAMDANTGMADAWFYTEHATSTGNTMLYICGEQVGLTGTDMLSTPVSVVAEAADFYFGSPSDYAWGKTITPHGEQFYGIPSDVAPGQKETMGVYTFGPVPGTSQELGVMLVTNGDRGAGNRGGATADTEALLLPGPGVNLPKKDLVGVKPEFGHGMSYWKGPTSGTF